MAMNRSSASANTIHQKPIQASGTDVLKAVLGAEQRRPVGAAGEADGDAKGKSYAFFFFEIHYFAAFEVWDERRRQKRERRGFGSNVICFSLSLTPCLPLVSHSLSPIFLSLSRNSLHRGCTLRPQRLRDETQTR